MSEAGVLWKLWKELLGCDPAEQEDFTRAGGSSIDAMELQLSIAKRLGKRIALDALPDPLLFGSLLKMVAAAPTLAPEKSTRAPHHAPATAAQCSQWTFERAHPTSWAYVVPVLLHVKGTFNLAQFSHALRDLVSMHPALRTVVEPLDGDVETLIQRVTAPPRRIAIEPRAVAAVDEALVKALLREGLVPRPSIEAASPFRVVGLTVEGEVRGVLLLLHHGAVDEWSLRVLLEDLAALLRGDNVEPESMSVLALEPEDPKPEDLKWWEGTLCDAPESVQFPAPTSKGIGGCVQLELSAEDVRALEGACAENGVESAAAIIYAVAQAVALHASTRPNVVSVGVPMSLRTDERLARTCGMFLNTLPIPVRVDEPCVSDSLQSLRSLLREARSRRAVPYETLRRAFAARRIDGRTPWLDVMVGIVERPLPESEFFLPTLIESLESAAPLLVVARRTGEGTIVFTTQVQPDKVDEETNAAIAARTLDVLRAIGGGETSDRRLSLIVGHATPEPPTVWAAVEHHAKHTPLGIAIEDGVETWTYERLVRESEQIARALVAEGVQRGAVVAVDLGRSACFGVAALGVMRAGGAVLPFQPGTPPARRRDLCARAGVTVTIDETWIEDARSGGDAPLPAEPTLASASYVLFTSGSTGEPKGVRMHQRPLANLIAFERRRNPAPLRTAMLAPLGFDVVFQELFGTWARGGTLIPVAEDVRRDPHALASFIHERSIERLHISPLMLRLLSQTLSDKDSRLASLAEIIAAGEALRIDDSIRSLAAAAGGINLVNQYGPTETHVATSIDLGGTPLAWPDVPSIGRPIDGVTVSIIDEQGDPVAQGFDGELIIGGRGPAVGYLDGDPEGRFIERDGERWYRTGDVARIDPTGVIEYRGRRDDQVKVASHRVELGEVEHVLARVDGVADAAVVAASLDGETVLWACVVPEEGVSLQPSQVGGALKELLPPHLCPQRIEVRATLPISANGKVNRRRLLESLQATHEELFDDGSATSDVEQLVGKALARSPRERRVALSALGLESLGAIKLQLDLERRFGVALRIVDLLEGSIEDLERALAEAKSSPVDSAVAPRTAPKDDRRNLLEQDLLAETAAATPGAFHLAWRIDFDEAIAPERVRESLLRLCMRHASLRTRRTLEGNSFVEEAEGLSPPGVEALHAAPDDATLGGLIRHDLDLGKGECMRALTWPRQSGTTVVLVVHHAAIDGRGAEALIGELLSDLDAQRDVDSSYSSSNVEHCDAFVERTDDVSWWIEHVERLFGDGLPQTPRRTGAEGLTSLGRVVAGGGVLAMARHCARVYGEQPNTVVLAAWAIMVGRLVGRDRVLIGVPFALDPSNEGSIRLGASMLPLAVDVSNQRTVADVISSVGLALVEGIEHRHASIGSVVRACSKESILARTPVDAVFTIDIGRRRLGGATVSWEPAGVSPFQAAIIVEEGLAPGLVVQAEDGLLGGETIESCAERFEAVLHAIVANEETSGTVGSLPFESPRQAQRRASFESGGTSQQSVDSLGTRFEAVVARAPSAVAVRCAEGTYSYEDLEAWSRSVASTLLAQGLRAGDRVALPGVGSPTALATILGIVRAGGVYVPIDPAVPVERRASMLKAAEVRCAIGFDTPLEVERSLAAVPFKNDAPLRDLPTGSSGDGLYVMFTSGTTGEPKGALVSHEAVARLCDEQFFLSLSAEDCMLHAAPLGFDASTLELWAPLLAGSSIAVWEGASADLLGLAEWVARSECTVAWLTSALFQAAVDGVPSLFDRLEVLLTGGDVVSAAHVQEVLARNSDLIVVNGYGPTENTVFTACDVITASAEGQGDRLSIGRPVRGTTVRILGRDGERLPLGCAGELVAGGRGLASMLGGEKANRFFEWEGEAWYRTGDVARWSPDGRLAFLGRLDAQVKIGGHRVEPSAVEQVLRRIDGVNDACVSVIGDGARRKLVAAVAGVGVNVTPAHLRLSVRGVLSPVEVPSSIIVVPRLPVTGNGKVDRAAVARLFEAAPTVDRGAVASGELIDVINDVVQTTLGRQPSSNSTLLSEEGIDSLDLVRITFALGDRLARPVQLGDVLRGGSIEGIAACVQSELAREEERLVVLRNAATETSANVYCVPGVGGTVFSFGGLLESIDSSLGVFGLPYPGLVGSEAPLDSVEALADRFADEIIRFRPATLIVGYSLGGFVAFETARRVLERTGVAPEVVVIDAAPAALPKWTFGESRSLGRSLRLRLEAVLPPGVAALVRGRGKAATLTSLRRVVAAGFKSVRQYAPTPAPLNVTLVRTSETFFGEAEKFDDLGWSHLAAQTSVRRIDGEHLEVFRGNTAMDVGVAVSEQCARAGRLQPNRRAFRISRKNRS